MKPLGPVFQRGDDFLRIHQDIEPVNSKGGGKMGSFRFIILIAAAAVFFWSAPAIPAEYYVIESKSGIILITDHEPQGGATLLKGPFETEKAAEEALTDEEKERLGTPGKGKGQGKGRGQGKNR
jgi:hypothetical protein